MSFLFLRLPIDCERSANNRPVTMRSDAICLFFAGCRSASKPNPMPRQDEKRSFYPQSRYFISVWQGVRTWDAERCSKSDSVFAQGHCGNTTCQDSLAPAITAPSMNRQSTVVKRLSLTSAFAGLRREKPALSRWERENDRPTIWYG
jgi:hypothetical protein